MKDTETYFFLFIVLDGISDLLFLHAESFFKVCQS